MTTNELRKELIVKHLKNNAYNLADEILSTSKDWSDPYVERIKTFRPETLQQKILEILYDYRPCTAVVSAFANFITEESDCAEQIFFMRSDLKDIWFELLRDDDDSLSQLSKIETAIKNGDFHTNDLFWEMPNDKPIHSFNELRESKKFEEHALEFANSIIADDKNDLGLPYEVFTKIRGYLKDKGI